MNCGTNGRCATVVAVPGAGSFLSDFWRDPFFAPFLGATERPTRRPEGAPARAFPMDVSETPTHLIVRATLPGFSKDQLSVEVHEGVLSISAQPREQPENEQEQFHLRERHAATLTRRIHLPTPVVESDSQAELRDGVLTLRLAKVPDAQPRKIAIN